MRKTETIRIDPTRPDPAALEMAAGLLRRGGLVAIPTETVYGLAANALNPVAIEQVFEAKGRPARNPLIVHVGDTKDALHVASQWPVQAARLAERFWPGPLTLVLPKHPDIPAVVTAGGPTVAVRVPAHPVAQGLLQIAGFPLAAPSANRSGEISPTTAEHVRRSLDGRIDLILDAGPTQIGLESTVLSLVEPDPRLLRPGHISPRDIEAVIGPIRLGLSAVATGPLPSPGMLSRHYAPHTPTEVVESANSASRVRIEELRADGLCIGWVTFANEMDRPGIVVRRMPADPEAFGARIYAVLHELDQMGLYRIVVELPPESDDWVAVRDRLQRASAHD